MSEENVEIVRELTALRERARESGAPPTHTELLAPNFEIDMSRRVFNPAVYRGMDGRARLNEEIRDVWVHGRATRVEIGLDRDDALKAVGLEE